MKPYTYFEEYISRKRSKKIDFGKYTVDYMVMKSICNYCNKKIYSYKKINLNFLSILKKIKIFIPDFILKKLVDRSFNKKIKILKNYNIKVDETEIDEIISLIKTNPIML